MAVEAWPANGTEKRSKRSGTLRPEVEDGPLAEVPKNAGRWCSSIGAFVTGFALGLCVLALFLPWWTGIEESGSRKVETRVTLWVTTVITEERPQLKVHQGCDNACDKTRVSTTTITETEVGWGDQCRGVPELAETCRKLWCVRGGVFATVFCGLLFIFPSCTSLGGSDQRSAVRFPPACGLVLAGGCAAILAFTVIAAAITDLPQSLNGGGFGATVAALVLSLLNLGVMVLAQVAASMSDEVEEMVLPEPGSPTSPTSPTRVRRGPPPLELPPPPPGDRPLTQLHAWGP